MSSAITRLSRRTLGHIVVDNSQGQTFGDRGFSDAWLADQNRVVFRSAGKDLDHAADLFVATDDRIKFAGLRQFNEIDAYFSSA